jgi:hypothetical protein
MSFLILLCCIVGSNARSSYMEASLLVFLISGERLQQFFVVINK